MKKIISALAIVLFAVSISFAASDISDLSGQLKAKVNHELAQGAQVLSFDFQPIYYFMQPTAPYQSGTVTIQLVKNVDLGGGVFSKALITITADEIVTKNGVIKFENIQVN